MQSYRQREVAKNCLTTISLQAICLLISPHLKCCDFFSSIFGMQIRGIFGYYRPQRSCGQGYVFTRVCDSVHRGGTKENPPTHPWDQGEPPREQADTPPRPGRPPRDQADPPPRTKENPPGPRRTPRWDQGDPPGTKENPPGPGRPPQDQGEPPGTKENPPPGPRRPTRDQGEPPWDQADPPGTRRTPPGRTLQHTVNERPVRILLECILVLINAKEFCPGSNSSTL